MMRDMSYIYYNDISDNEKKDQMCILKEKYAQNCCPLREIANEKIWRLLDNTSSLYWGFKQMYDILY